MLMSTRIICWAWFSTSIYLIASFFAKKAGYPRYKSKHNHCLSYRSQYVNNNIAIKNGKLKLPKIGLVKIKLSRKFTGRILNVTVSRKATGKYFVSLCVEEEVEIFPNNGGEIGIDVGIKVLPRQKAVLVEVGISLLKRLGVRRE